MIPPNRITVGVDFSDNARVALAFAARLAVQTGGALKVVHVQDPLLTAAAERAHIDLHAESVDELQRFILSAPPADSVDPERFVFSGAAGPTLCEIAAREQTDILVVGAHGMSGAARWLFGTNTERVLRAAQMSVLVVPSTWQPARPATRDLSGLGPVVAAVDCTQPAITALYAAAHLARLLATRLEVVHVVPHLRVPERWRAHADTAVHDVTAAVKGQLDRHVRQLEPIAPTRLTVLSGDTVDSILHAADPGDGRAPLLVLGRRSPLNDEAPGTVVSRTLASLRVPLLVVHPREVTR